MYVEFPYGRTKLSWDIPEERCTGVLTSRLYDYIPEKTQEEMVREALEHPIGTPRLRDLARDRKKIVILASDHTRPVPSRILAPLILKEIRSQNPEADITFLVATGCHRGITKEELREKFGDEIAENEKIQVHDCDDMEQMADFGILPSGGSLLLNKLAAQADLLVAEGFIEPHFFAGFSGGRKSVLPGIAARKTVMYNHNAAFIDHACARTGILEGNPIHRDMLYAGRKAGLDFICNVVLNSEKRIICAVAGDLEEAHRKGRDFLKEHCQAAVTPADIVITTNGGYPLDQNIYQAVKGINTAETAVKKDGVIIMLASAADGHGGESFYQMFCGQKDLKRMMRRFLDTPAEETLTDQWQAQILARALLHASVILVSDMPDEMVREFQMIPAHSVEEAVKTADEILRKRGIKNGKILAIPDGVSVIAKKQRRMEKLNNDQAKGDQP